MKGIIKLTPIEKPEEGMKVVTTAHLMTGKQLYVETIKSVEEKENCMNNGYLITTTDGDFYRATELQQLVVEYKELTGNKLIKGFGKPDEELKKL